MTAYYCIDKESRLVKIRYSGDVASTEALGIIRAFADDPSFEPSFRIISDRRKATGMPETSFVQALAQFVNDHHDKFAKCKWALVAGDKSNAGMTRMASLLTEGTSVLMKAFTDIDQAQEWLQAGSSSRF